MLSVEGLTTAYGPVRAVDEVSLEAAAGTVTAVLGANGAGKTSLLRTITGLVPARSGRVRFDGEDITRMAVEEIVRRGVAHVPEGRGVISELTAEENLRLGGLWRGRGAAPVSEIYDLFPRLAERRRQPASRLSGGERQMLSVGRALMGLDRLRGRSRRPVRSPQPDERRRRPWMASRARRRDRGLPVRPARRSDAVGGVRGQRLLRRSRRRAARGCAPAGTAGRVLVAAVVVVADRCRARGARLDRRRHLGSGAADHAAQLDQ